METVLRTISELESDARNARAALRNLAGTAVDGVCGVCRRLASDHHGNTTTGCSNANELPDDEYRQVLNLVIDSAVNTTDQLRSRVKLTDQMSEMHGKLDNLNVRINLADKSYADLKAEHDGALRHIKDTEDKLKSAVSDDDVNKRVKKAQVSLCQDWVDFVTGKISDVVLVRNLDDKWDIAINDDVLSDFPSRAPLISTPTLADTDASGANSGVPSGSSNSAAPVSAPAPVSVCSYATGGAPSGDKVGKSAKTIDVRFGENDMAHCHVQKESSLLNEVGLIYPNSNLATVISIFITHCDPPTKDIAISVRDTATVPFTSMHEYLKAFRLARYPTFHDDCRLAFDELKQSQNESAIQFYFRFEYLLKTMSGNVEDYRDEFFRKLLYNRVRDTVRLFPKDEKSIRDLAGHATMVENELGLRRTVYQRDAKYDVMSCYISDEEELSGDSGGGNRRHRRRGRRNSGTGDRERVTFLFSRMEAWGLAAYSCFHCFGDHAARDGPCAGSPCLFCGNFDHLSVRCGDAPPTRSEFEEVMDKAKEVENDADDDEDDEA